jgi:hypothetical protein
MDSINKYEVLKLLGSVLENNNIKNSQIKKICLEFDKALEYGEADKHKSKMSKFSWLCYLIGTVVIAATVYKLFT